MLGFFRGESAKRGNGGRRPAAEPRGHGGVRRGHRPHLEALETRLTPSSGTATWSGAVDSNWTTPGNWSGGTAPLPGYDLIFPANVTNFNAVDDFPAGTSFNSITIQAPTYDLTGNGVEVASTIGTTYTSGTSTAVNVAMNGNLISLAAGGTLDLTLAASTSAPQLNIQGGGTLDLQGQNVYSGTTTLAGPTTTLLVDSTVGIVQNSKGVLGGNGTVGNVTNAGGTVSPGHSPSPGVLNTGSLTLDSNSTFVASLDGTSPGNGSTGYDQVVASGAVALGNATLNATIGTGYTPTPGDALTIIQNNSGSAVTGTFAGDPEGGAVAIGSNLFRISYQGGSNHQNVVLTAVSDHSSIAITSSATSITYGQSVTFTATVTGIGSQATPTGTVAFYNGSLTAGGTELGSPVPLNGNGVASASYQTLPVGSPDQVYAIYIPDPTTDTFAGSTTTTPASVTVTPVTITVTGITAGNKVYNATNAANLNTSSAVLSGVLNGDDVTVNPNGYVATFSTANAGNNIPVTVSNLGLQGTGAGNYVLAQPTGVTGNITPAPLTLTANNQTVLQGNPIPTLTYTANGLQGSDTTASLTTQPFLSTTATSSSPAGTYPIDISGGSSTNYTITSYVPGTLTIVTSTGTTTTVTSSNTLAVSGQPVTFTATVSAVTPAEGTPTGTVYFFVGTTEIGSAPLDPATGQATLTTSSLSYGSHSIVAFYAGDSVFSPSTSSAVQTFITSAGTQPNLSFVAVRNRHGKIVAVELEAQIPVTSPGAGTPPGNAVFFVNGRASSQVVPVVDGIASLTVPLPRILNKLVFVRYLGYFNVFQPSVSTSRLVSRRSLISARSVALSMPRTLALEAATAELHGPNRVVKIVRRPSDR